MTHDPLCWCNSQHPDMKPGLLCPRQAECQCECTIIAKARADEREKAAQRVAGLLTDNNTQWDHAIKQAIHAAQGDTP